MKELLNTKVTRRQVLKVAGITGLAATFPTIVPSSVFGKNAPSNRITIGMIGMGRQAKYANLPPFLNSDDTKVLAVCDVDGWRLDNAKKQVDDYYKNKDCKAYSDWRDVIARDDIDAVMVSTSDQWHVPISLFAIKAGKHVCCEKPLTLSIGEGRVLADTAKEKGIVFRTDSECRSDAYMHKTSQLVLNGYLGKINRIKVGVPGTDISGGKPGPMPIPEELNYEMWVGPAPMKPYSVDRVHPVKSYERPGGMRCRETSEGMITNWGTHLLDVAQQLNGTERTGPISVEGTGKYPKEGSGIWQVLLDFNARFEYANGVVLEYFTDVPYLKVDGEEGWIKAHWHSKGGLTAHDKSIFRIKLKESEIHLPQRQDKEDFIFAIKNNCNTMADAEVGHRTCSMGQMAHIAIQRYKTLNWDPKAERFTNDDEANNMLHIPYRKPWDYITSLKF